MRFLDPHIHMHSRTTDDYRAMALAGIRAVVEPAFWLGQPRTSAGSFRDYFGSILDFEPTRAAAVGIAHRCCISLNPKEANDEAIAEEVLAILPEFLDHPHCVCVGEVGFDSITDAEETAFRAQVVMALERDLPIMVHTPHRDKKRGTERTIAILKEMGVSEDRAIIDHNTEETIAISKESGYWSGHTVYPETKLSAERFASIAFDYGTDRLTLNSSADWGPSDPLNVPKTAHVLLQRGMPEAQIQALVWDNPIAFYGVDRLALEASGDPA